MNTRMNTTQPVTAKVTFMLTRGNLIMEEWQARCSEAERQGKPWPEMPVINEADFEEIIAERTEFFSTAAEPRAL